MGAFELRCTFKKKYASYLSELAVSLSGLFKISILGSINSCLLANDLFSVKTKQGNNIKLDSIPKANVIAINPQGHGASKIRKHKYGET
jgi:hypothetical protein